MRSALHPAHPAAQRAAAAELLEKTSLLWPAEAGFGLRTGWPKERSTRTERMFTGRSADRKRTFKVDQST